MRFIKTCLLFLLSGFLFSQEGADTSYEYYYRKAVTLYNADDPTEASEQQAISLFDKTITLLSKKQRNSTVLMDCYVKAGNLYQGRQKYKEALPYYHNGMQLANRYNDNLFRYQFCLYTGSAKYSLNEIDSARYQFEKAAAIAGADKQYPDLPILYNSLGIIYYEAANYRQAINYFEQAVNSLQTADETYDESYASFKNNIAGCYGKLGEHRTSLNLYLELLPLNQISDGLLQNIGHAYYDLNKHDSAWFYLQKIPASETLAYARLLNEMARIKMESGHLLKAEQLFDSAINLIRRIPGYYKNKDKANSYLYRSQLAEKQQLYNEAISWCNIALQELHFTFKAQRAPDLPETVTDVVSPVVFFEALQQKAQLLYYKYEQEKEQQWGHAALQTWLLAVKTANYIKSDFDNDDALLFFNTNYSSRFKKAAALAVQLFQTTGNDVYKEAFLKITETYKGNVLYATTARNTAKASGLLPDSLLKKEEDLKQLLAVFTNRLNTTVSEEGANLIRKKITDIQVQLSRLHKVFETYPTYKNLATSVLTDSLTILQLQQQIDNSKAVLQMMWTDTTLLLLGCSREESWLKAVPFNKVQRLHLQQTVASLYKSEEGMRFGGYQSSALLYQHLKKYLPAVFLKKKQWLLLPDGVFNYLPWETLVTNAVSRSFLASQKIISYHYSLSMLLQQKAPLLNNSNALAFAPFDESSLTINQTVFPALPSSSAEVDIWSGKKLKGTAATKQQFVKLAPTEKILHLATHATAISADNKNQTYIQFYASQRQQTDFTRLYLHELYTMRFLNNPLVILSACETAAGESGDGEGLLSLSRGFLYAGCSGIVSTYWKAEDVTTAYLIKRMHYYIQKNYSVETALHYAKVDFLNDDQIDVRFKAPNYWGHVVYIGAVNMNELNNTIHLSNWIIVPLAVLLTALLCFYFFKFLPAASKK